MAIHNGEKYIKEQLDSILCQLSSDDEVIISDDGSTDNTLSIIGAYNDSRIKIFHFTQLEKNKVPHYYCTKNFENALKQAKGDFIFLSDQDDWWMPNKVRKCISALEKYMLVVHRALVCDDNLSSKGTMIYGDEFVFKNYLSLKRGKYYGCTLAFRKDLLKYILPFPSELILHDQWIGCMSELTGTVYYEKEPLIRYRQHGGNVSGGPSPYSLWFKIQYRLYMFYNFIKYKLVK